MNRLRKLAGPVTFVVALWFVIAPILAVAQPIGKGVPRWVKFYPAFTGGTVGGATTFSGAVTFNGSGNVFSNATAFNTDAVLSFGTGSTQAALAFQSTPTPDAMMMWTGPLSNSWHLIERADAGFDFQNGRFTTAAATDPYFVIHSHNQSTAQYIALDHDGTTGNIGATGALRFLTIAGFDGGLHFRSQTGGSSGITWGSAAAPAVYLSMTQQTPDGPWLATDTVSQSWNFGTNGGSVTDGNNGPCNGAACVDPNFIIHPATPTGTTYTSIQAGVVYNRALKTLTESAATSTARINVAALTGTGGDFDYCVHANDATDIQERCGYIKFSVVNKAGTETCMMTSVAGTADASVTETEDGSGTGAISAGTLTYAVTCSTSPTNGVDLQINAVSSLTQTVLEARYGITLNGPGTVTRQ